MTAAVPDQPRPYSTWLFHNKTAIWLVFIAASIAIRAFEIREPLLLAPYLVAFVLFVASFFAEHRHDAILCPGCMAEFPLNGPEQAEQNLRWLRLWHRGWTRAGLLWLFLFVGFVPWWWAGVPGLVAVFADYLIGRVHRRLCPWCPWCNPNRGRGDRQVVPPPVPTRTGDR